MAELSAIWELAQGSLGASEAAGAVLRASVGTFFAISGWNKLTNKERHAGLLHTLEEDRIPFPRFMQWWVPGWELAAGVMLAAGVAKNFAALVLLIICLVACMAEARGKVESYKPINAGDRVADWLYLPEVLYVLMLVAALLV